jgi:hypothetical protein
MDIEAKVHIRQVAHKLLRHSLESILHPFSPTINLCDISMPYQNSQEVVVVAQCLPGPGSYCRRLQTPERGQGLVDGIEFVYQLKVILLCKVIPFVKVRWWRYSVSTAVFRNCFSERCGLSRLEVFELFLGVCNETPPGMGSRGVGWRFMVRLWRTVAGGYSLMSGFGGSWLNENRCNGNAG